jgi:hypothetical protein
VEAAYFVFSVKIPTAIQNDEPAFRLRRIKDNESTNAF